jgi:hypothetical protein
MSYYGSYSSFKTGIYAQLDTGSAIPSASLDNLINVGERKLLRKLRVRQMETALSSTIGSTAGTVSVPSDYIEMKHAYVNSDPIRNLQRKTPGWIYEKYPDRSAGDEYYFAREGNEFIFGEGGTPGRLMKGIYYAEPTLMTTTINSLFSEYPDLYFFAVLSEAEPFIGRDSRIALWESKFQQLLQQANQQDKDEQYSGAPLSATVS